MKLTLSIILSFYLSICYCQTYSDEINNKEISTFFEELNLSKRHEIKKINRQIISWEKEQIFGTKDSIKLFLDYEKYLLTNDTINKYLSVNDIDYIQKQYLSFKKANWNLSEFKDFELIDSVEINKILNRSIKKKRRLKNNYAYSFSIPLFSLDKKYVILIEEYYCGFMCSDQCIKIYQKIDNSANWKEIAHWSCFAT